MHTGRDFEPIRRVLSEADEPLTAREILVSLEEQDDFESAHRVATLLGQRAERGDVQVIRDSPYRYELNT